MYVHQPPLPSAQRPWGSCVAAAAMPRQQGAVAAEASPRAGVASDADLTCVAPLDSAGCDRSGFLCSTSRRARCWTSSHGELPCRALPRRGAQATSAVPVVLNVCRGHERHRPDRGNGTSDVSPVVAAGTHSVRARQQGRAA